MIVDGETVARFVSDRLGVAFCPPYTTLGIEKAGRVVAGVLLNHFEGSDCHLTAAGSGWTREFMRLIGEYIFEQLGCVRFTVITEQPEVVKLARKLGGTIEGVLRSHYGPGRDGTIIGVLAEEYRFGYPLRRTKRH